jgi:hypothetical protein
VNEYLWQVLEADEPLGQMLSILDFSGLHLGILRQAELLSFSKEFVMTMDAHFPGRAYKTLIVNAPRWFQALYKVVSPLLRETTKAKVEILHRGKRQDKALLNRLGENAAQYLPESFWSWNKKAKNGKHKKRKHDEEEEEPVEENQTDSSGGDDDGLIKPAVRDNFQISSPLEEELRSWVLARLEIAGETMEEVLMV